MNTAGLRRRRKINDTIEYFSTIRTEQLSICNSIYDKFREILTDQTKKY